MANSIALALLVIGLIMAAITLIEAFVTQNGCMRATSAVRYIIDLFFNFKIKDSWSSITIFIHLLFSVSTRWFLGNLLLRNVHETSWMGGWILWIMLLEHLKMCLQKILILNKQPIQRKFWINLFFTNCNIKLNEQKHNWHLHIRFVGRIFSSWSIVFCFCWISVKNIDIVHSQSRANLISISILMINWHYMRCV